MTDKKIYYTGIGSRSTPAAYMLLMENFAERLSRLDIILRSGGADGADSAFEKGVIGDLKEIFLPWPNFNHNKSDLCNISVEAYKLAWEHHPHWAALKQSVRKLHARNVHQILGKDLKTPSSAVICWTQDGANTAKDCTRLTGGTGMAIRIAHEHKVPVYNIKNREDYSKCIEWITNLGDQK
jgi:hypothetical protein